MTEPELVFTRGLPASGKTTYARSWVAESPGSRARINRDDFRAMCHDGYFEKGVTEKQILTVCDASISALLKRGVSVINDDTNLPQRRARELKRLAVLAGATWRVEDLTNVSLVECIYRDYNRFSKNTYVGSLVITDMYDRFVKGKGYPLPLPYDDPQDNSGMKPYIPNGKLRDAIIVDIDGTVALIGNRGRYEEDKIHLDRPNIPVVAAVQYYRFMGYAIVVCSGRGSDCREETLGWLREFVVEPDLLVMRSQGDFRKDYKVKYELFDEHIRDNYNVKVVFDDRNQVVDMWRSIGLTVFQVAEGNF